MSFDRQNLFKQLNIQVRQGTIEEWKRRAKRQDRTLSEFVRRKVNAGGPEWPEARAALIQALPNDPAWASWVDANMKPLWCEVSEPTREQWLSSPAGLDLAEAERKSKAARAMKRFRYLKSWKDWGDSAYHAYLGVIHDGEKRGAKMPAGWRERAQAIRDAAPPDWGKQYLALFPDLA